MSTFEYDGNIFEVEVEKADNRDMINIAFTDSSDYGLVYGWVQNADLSHLVFENEDGEPDVYDGYSVFNAIVALNATENDFWDGIRMVVALGRPIAE